MTLKVPGLVFLMALVMLASPAAAEADGGNATSDRPDDAAWVEDCPPDMMCAAASSDDQPKDDVSRGDDCDFCRDVEPEECTHCTSAPVEDNTTWGTDCPPGVYCMDDGTPDDAGWVDCGGEVCAYEAPMEPAMESAEAPGPAAAALVGVLAVVAAALAATLRKQ